MTETFSTQIIEALPKSDLHVHLDGSLRLETLIELAEERGVHLPSQTPEGLLELVFKEQYRDLPDYLHGFAYTCAVLTDAEALERVAYELAQDCLAEGVRYVEVRFAPQLHVREDLDIGRVLEAVDRALVERVLIAGRAVGFDEEMAAEASAHVALASERSVLCTPVFVRGRAVACLYATHGQLRGLFGKNEERLADYVATITGAALENAEGFQQLQQLNATLEQRVAERTAAANHVHRNWWYRTRSWNALRRSSAQPKSSSVLRKTPRKGPTAPRASSWR